jgi:galactokinase
MKMEIFVPGRICLFGEHSDWAGGYRRLNPAIEKGQALIAGTEQGIHARVERDADKLVLTSIVADRSRHAARSVPPDAGGGFDDPVPMQGEPRVIPMEADALLREAEQGGFWSYVAGVALHVLHRHSAGGLVLDNHAMDLPLRKGLSSSAAICVLTARAFNRLYDLGLTTREEMELAYQGEICTPSRCGRMDQGCAFGRGPIRMTFDGDSMETAEITPTADLHLFIVDLRAGKDTRAILARLNRAYPFADGAIARGVQELLGPINAGLVDRAGAALAAGDAERLGSLMREAQDQFDRLALPACPEELSAPVLHRVLCHAPLQHLVWGGKGVGSQGDGAAQFVARSAADRDAAMAAIRRDLGMPSLPLTLAAPHRAFDGTRA